MLNSAIPCEVVTPPAIALHSTKRAMAAERSGDLPSTFMGPLISLR